MNHKTLKIDVAGICSVNHNCNCCEGESKNCCSSYEVTVTGREMKNIIGYMPMATRFCSQLKTDNDLENVFERVQGRLYSIDTNDDGSCVFSYFEKGKIVCSLHAVAAHMGIPFRKVKPESCLLWPLAIFEGESRILSIDDDIFEFRCNTPRRKGTMSLCPSIADNIERLFGIEFRNDMQDAASKGLLWTEIPLRIR
jgi:hypothetical protein